MTEFEQILSDNYSQEELDQAIRDAVAGAAQDILSAMPADAWR